MRCSVCETDNPAHNRFCGGCGAPLAQPCDVCGSTVPSGQPFCGQCGAQRAQRPAVESPPETDGSNGPLDQPPTTVPLVERRVCSVLFCDLVGFTSLSETRDAEEVRELLSRYFETARMVIGRYGGVVEKFIGDAVMAVWGTPTVTEEDAERAVRAAIDLIDAVEPAGPRGRYGRPGGPGRRGDRPGGRHDGGDRGGDGRRGPGEHRGPRAGSRRTRRGDGR